MATRVRTLGAPYVMSLAIDVAAALWIASVAVFSGSADRRTAVYILFVVACFLPAVSGLIAIRGHRMFLSAAAILGIVIGFMSFDLIVLGLMLVAAGGYSVAFKRGGDANIST